MMLQYSNWLRRNATGIAPSGGAPAVRCTEGLAEVAGTVSGTGATVAAAITAVAAIEAMPAAPMR
ncbi:hypothetical protein SAMN04489835_3459 [Mycolicibacterium rutilum]|uniref:Uncharacterized protein n=1 Tax=Mycolicibacterium rutilum TaxID=370526 RepID=A0A1H6KPU5_MYCRU|nr:hypothetical protein SAMN04489835_3459 [Mycolicibacterium rutilum]